MAKRGGLPLGTRIFLLTALLILLAVGVAVVVTYFQGRQIADSAVDSALEGSSAAQAMLQRSDANQLEQIARHIVVEPSFQAYVAEARTQGDSASVIDLLEERRQDSYFDFAIFLDDQGVVLARTDDPSVSGENLSSRAVIAEVMKVYDTEQQTAAGLWLEGDELFTMAVVPIQIGFDLYGFLALAFPMDEPLATAISDASGTHVALLSLVDGKPVLLASSNASPSAAEGVGRELVQQLVAQEVFAGRSVGQESQRVSLNGTEWQARARPLLDNAGETVGAMVALASLNALRAPFNAILKYLLIAGVLSLIAALGLSYALSRRTLAPIERLSEAAAGARQGQYDLTIPVERDDEVGQLAESFNSLLADLRQKQDMEAYMTQLSRNLPDGAAPGAGKVVLEPEARETTALAVELRRYSRARTTSETEETSDRLARDVRRIQTAVASQNGRCGVLSGHRVTAWFDGPMKSRRALTAAARIALSVGGRENAFDDEAPPLIALSAGSALFAPLTQARGADTTVVGMPVQKLEALMREAAPGDILLTREVVGELDELLAGAEHAPREGRSLFSPLPVFTLTVDTAAALTGVDRDEPEAEAADTEQPTISDIATGAVVGDRFEIAGVLGVGGMGVVYKARDRELGEFVALKVLKRELWNDPVQLSRLKDEIRLARKVTHPNVLRTYDFGDLDGIPYISMEYVRGVTLRFLLDQSDRFPFTAGLRLARQLCAGLIAAHAEGVMHRDIKPENLLIDHVGNARLMDFGIARPVERVEPGHTREGWLVGTPRYLAPEQVEGQAVDARSDLYACGVLFYELFTGELPFEEATMADLLTQKLGSDPVAPRERWDGMPEKLDQIIIRCMQRDPDQRYQHAEELLAELDTLA